MAQLIIRNIESEVKERLKHRAKSHGLSMEQEAREILRSTVYQKESAPDGLGSDIATLFSGIGLDADIRELHDQKIKVERFGK